VYEIFSIFSFDFFAKVKYLNKYSVKKKNEAKPPSPHNFCDHKKTKHNYFDSSKLRGLKIFDER